MGATYEERAGRRHRPIPHDPADQTPVDPSEHPLLNYQKRVIAIHNLLHESGKLPSFDPIRRVAEEVDAQFAQGTPPDTIPPGLSLNARAPTYYERRVLAVEAWLIEQGLMTTEEQAAILREAQKPPAHCC